MAASQVLSPADLTARIVAILDENHIMSVATLRSDGWPQATMVGFIHDQLDLYFVVARDSQKFDNISRDPRVSIAIGASPAGGQPVRGLSMAARAAEVTAPEDVDRINRLILSRHPSMTLFAPASASAAIIRATPCVLSIIDYAEGRGHRTLVEVEANRQFTVRPV